MEIIELSKEKYKEIVKEPFSMYDTTEFVETNKSKVDIVKYLVFSNNKHRFALVLGIKNNIIQIPFSATFGCFSEITSNNKIEYYYEAVKSLIIWAQKQKIKSIIINNPAIIYSKTHITKFQNALINNGFSILYYDLNYEFILDSFSEKLYKKETSHSARKCLNNAKKYGLVFEKTNDIETVYNIIKHNRDYKGYPLRMTLQEVINNVIQSDFFLIKTNDGIPIASALIHHLTKDVLRVVYWGNLNTYEQYRPINFLAYNLLIHYKNSCYKIIDIGTSTVDSIANFGLCNFKESIGCQCSPKLSWKYTF